MAVLIDWNENNIQLQQFLAPNLRSPAAHAVVASALEGGEKECVKCIDFVSCFLLRSKEVQICIYNLIIDQLRRAIASIKILDSGLEAKLPRKSILNLRR